MNSLVLHHFQNITKANITGISKDLRFVPEMSLEFRKLIKIASMLTYASRLGWSKFVYRRLYQNSTRNVHLFRHGGKTSKGKCKSGDLFIWRDVGLAERFSSSFPGALLSAANKGAKTRKLKEKHKWIKRGSEAFSLSSRHPQLFHSIQSPCR